MMLHNLLAKEIILASGSPRRAQLLSELGLEFKVITKDVEESFAIDLLPWEVAEYLANKKSDAYNNEFQEDWILITADTLVSTGNTILNKPSNRPEAIEMISQLSGNTHDVITGVSVRSVNKQTTFHTVTQVRFCELTLSEIEHYIDQYKPYDKAGAYGIQEWIGTIGVSSIHGSFQNVVGLPTQDLYQVLKSF